MKIERECKAFRERERANEDKKYTAIFRAKF